MSFQELFETFVLASAEHQEHAQEVVGGRPFTVDLGQGVAALGDLLTRAELIGTESTSLQSWMWSWANPSGFGEHVVRPRGTLGTSASGTASAS